ncbi:hypothetical protein MC885_006461 [Smutsia gigantea]|nr:hypothetical protein MC885_006461 [Smutsia gigantea]
MSVPSGIEGKPRETLHWVLPCALVLATCHVNCQDPSSSMTRPIRFWVSAHVLLASTRLWHGWAVCELLAESLDTIPSQLSLYLPLLPLQSSSAHFGGNDWFSGPAAPDRVLSPVENRGQKGGAPAGERHGLAKDAAAWSMERSRSNDLLFLPSGQKNMPSKQKALRHGPYSSRILFLLSEIGNKYFFSILSEKQNDSVLVKSVKGKVKGRRVGQREEHVDSFFPPRNSFKIVSGPEEIPLCGDQISIINTSVEKPQYLTWPSGCSMFKQFHGFLIENEFTYSPHLMENVDCSQFGLPASYAIPVKELSRAKGEPPRLGLRQWQAFPSCFTDATPERTQETISSPKAIRGSS